MRSSAPVLFQAIGAPLSGDRIDSASVMRPLGRSRKSFVLTLGGLSLLCVTGVIAISALQWYREESSVYRVLTAESTDEMLKAMREVRSERYLPLMSCLAIAASESPVATIEQSAAAEALEQWHAPGLGAGELESLFWARIGKLGVTERELKTEILLSVLADAEALRRLRRIVEDSGYPDSMRRCISRVLATPPDNEWSCSE